MLLKRQEKDGVIKAMYDSSNILASIFDTTTSDLTLIFKAGTQYRYDKVSKSDYLRFEIAESQGVVFNEYIKKYTFTKLDAINPSLITEEIQNIKAAEDQALLDGLKNKLTQTSKRLLSLLAPQTDDSNPQITNTLLDATLHKLKKEIDEYLTFKK